MNIFCKYFWKNLKYEIRDFFFPRQRWLMKNVSNHWCDKVELIPIVLFEILVNFVEEEMGIVSWDWQEEVNLGYTSQEYADKVKQVEKEIYDVYNYIKVTRPKLQKALDNSYPPIGTEGSYKELYAETCSLETKLEDLDEWAMNSIIKNRQYLWT